MNNRKRQKLKNTRGVKLNKLQIWNLRQTFATYIAGGLRQFMNRNIYGYPSDLERNEKEDPDGSIAMQEWRAILKEMLWSFEQIANDMKDTPTMKWYGERYKILRNQGISDIDILLSSKLPDIPRDIYQADIKHGERLPHGIDLFAKYFLDLWD
ncbi:MAG: hypothetical protein IKN43_07600 [Selenomonadaceae bacterium]|nr:hypothetical protein [Selenomonadaceae bacterium]